MYQLWARCDDLDFVISNHDPNTCFLLKWKYCTVKINFVKFWWWRSPPILWATDLLHLCIWDDQPTIVTIQPDLGEVVKLVKCVHWLVKMNPVPLIPYCTSCDSEELELVFVFLSATIRVLWSLQIALNLCFSMEPYLTTLNQVLCKTTRRAMESWLKLGI